MTNRQVPPPNSSASLLELLRSNWFILIFMGSLIASWTVYTSKVSNLEKEVAVVKSNQATMANGFNTLSVQMARIEAELNILNEYLQER